MTDWHFPPGQNFECSRCARCCRGWRIQVDAQTAQTLKQTPFRTRLEEKEGRTFARKDAQEGCTFLTPDLRCQIHSELGGSAKPRGCRQFPFRLTRTPDGVFVGASFSCPSIQNNQGLPLQDYQAELEDLALDLPLWGGDGLKVWGACRLEWPAYRLLETHTLAQESVEDGVAEALWALSQFSLAPQRPIEAYLERSAAALEPPEEPLILMERHWFRQLLSHCDEEAPARSPGRAAPQQSLEHYLRSLLQRKALINRRPLLGNLALLHLVPSLIRFWFERSSSLDHALDQCERKIVTHPNNLDDLVEQMADDFRGQLDPETF